MLRRRRKAAVAPATDPRRESGGRTQRANRDLIAQNARLAGEIAATPG